MLCTVITLALVACISLTTAQDAPGAIVVHPPTYSTASTGQTVRMTCAAYGNPTPSITWTRAGLDLASKLSNSNSGYKQYDQTVTVNGTDFTVSVLEICGVTISETDEYWCTADNGIAGAGVASSEAKFFLSVTGLPSEPPAVVVRPPSEGTTVDYGNTVEAVCVAYGNPLPTVSWTKDGCSDISCSSNAKIFDEVVTYGDVTFRKSILQLCNVSEANSGSFRCSAMNGIGGDGVAPKSFSWDLTVNPRPTSSSSSSSSVVVVPTTSCPVLTSTMGAGRSTAAPSPTVGRAESSNNLADETTYQAVVAAETVVIIILIIIVVIAVIVAMKSRRSPTKQRADIAATQKSPPLYSVENPIHKDEDKDSLDEEDHKDTMTYADLAKKMEEES